MVDVLSARQGMLVPPLSACQPVQWFRVPSFRVRVVKAYFGQGLCVDSFVSFDIIVEM
jgi:hypothetical protein